MPKNSISTEEKDLCEKIRINLLDKVHDGLDNGELTLEQIRTYTQLYSVLKQADSVR